MKRTTYLRALLVLFFVSCFPALLPAQRSGIRGTIRTAEGEPLAYATIFCKTTRDGTTANTEGRYELPLPPGDYQVIFQYLGYEPVARNVQVTDGWAQVDVELKEQAYVLKEVNVKSSKEDPAYYIMRKAIGMSSYYYRQVERYQARLYLKGSGALEKIPKMFQKRVEKDAGIKEGETFLIENISELTFEQPDVYNEKVLSSKSSGTDGGVSAISFVRGNLYQPDWNGLISPLSPVAFTYYDFRYEGGFQDRGRYINKIKITPRRKGQDLISGYIFIAEDYWNIHSVDFALSVTGGDVAVKALYEPVEENVWMPFSYDIRIKAGLLGFAVTYKYLALVNSYQVTLNPKLDHNIFERAAAVKVDNVASAGEPSAPASKRQQQIEELLSKEELTKGEALKLARKMEQEARANTPKQTLEDRSTFIIDSLAGKKDSTYWQEVRPVPLTELEIKSYRKRDSVVLVRDNPAYRDSVNLARRRFKLKHALGGHHYRYDSSAFSIKWDGLLNSGFNTVDGLNFSSQLSFLWNPKSRKNVEITPLVRYNIARRAPNATLKIGYQYLPRRLGNVTVEGGRFVADLSNRGITPSLNTYTTLLLEQNFLKLYERDFVKLSHRIELAHSLLLFTDFEYASRRFLDNNSAYRLVDVRNRGYTPNEPVNENLPDGTRFDAHRAAIFFAALQFTPNRRYRIRNNQKFYLSTQSPTFQLSYRKGISGLADSEVDYDQLQFLVRQNLKVGYQTTFSWLALAGQFLNNNQLFFPDFYHFRGNQSPVFTSEQQLSNFRRLDYYLHSTNGQYAEAHAELTTYRLLLKRLPLLNMTSMEEHLFARGMQTDSNPFRWEAGYGLGNILGMGRVDVLGWFTGGRYEGIAVRGVFSF